MVLAKENFGSMTILTLLLIILYIVWSVISIKSILKRIKGKTWDEVMYSQLPITFNLSSAYWFGIHFIFLSILTVLLILATCLGLCWLGVLIWEFTEQFLLYKLF